jgi:cbb3-type cytochrome oxidase cytochrome c subunit
MSSYLLRLAFLLALCCPSVALAQDEDDEQRPGLIAVYKAGSRTISRVDDDIAFHWGPSSPDVRLPSAPFEVTWTGQIVIQSDEPIRFHADVQGTVEIRIDDEVVLQGENRERGWISGESKAHSLGFRDIKVTFKKLGRSSHIFLAWSGEKYSMEPLPWQFLFHEGRLPEDELWNRGRQLFTAHRCDRCHKRPGEPESPFAPALLRVTTDLNPEWMVEKLLDQNPESPHAKMPSYGMTREQAEQISDWLWRISQPAQLPKTAKVEASKAKELPSGETLIRSLGCMACHKLGDLGESGPFGGGTLDHVGNKRSEDWIYTWLGQPEKLSPVTSMPVFKMTPSERATIAKSLSALSRKETTKFDRDVDSTDSKKVEAGRELAKRFKCANCHTMPAIDPEFRGLPTLEEEVKDWSKSCLADSADQERNRPYYPRADKEALKAYVTSRFGAISPMSEFELGRHTIERRNCLSCHPRGTDRGLAEQAGDIAAHDMALTGVAPTLVAPNLTAIGDKQRDEFLEKSISGMQPDMRMPWLKVRMPRFTHHEDEKQAILSYLINHDRIADGADATLRQQLAEISEQERLVVGRRLVGAGGFSCIACHQFGTYVPKNTALGTKGSDLMGLGNRLRPEYFLRWTNSPLRIIPGFEMPSYQRPVPGVLENDVIRQLSAVWHAVNDPKFEAPTNPSAVEQLLTVQKGAAPRIVRDVFSVPASQGEGTVPRAIAIGFDNGHSLLFDYDHFAIRDWTIGDFARQRTEGKSWYWDLAGLRPIEGFDAKPVVRLYSTKLKRWMPLEPPEVCQAGDYLPSGRPELVGYKTVSTPPGVTVRISLLYAEARADHFQHLFRTFDLAPILTFEPVTHGDRVGWRWTTSIFADDVAELDLVPHLLLPISGEAMAAASLEVSPNREAVDCEGRTAYPFTRTENGDYQIAVESTSRLANSSTILPAAMLGSIDAAPVNTLPGYEGRRLPLPGSIMPTAMTWMKDGTLALTSLKGHVYLCRDSNGDGLEDSLTLFDEGLAAPFGIIEDQGELLVAHKPEVLRLQDTDGDGRCDVREVIATGWGYTDDYHDWTTGIARDKAGNLYIGTSSDYADRNRDPGELEERGKILKLSPDRTPPVEPRSKAKGLSKEEKLRWESLERLAKRLSSAAWTMDAIGHDLRYPIGLAIDSKDRLFASDQQGVQNTFNEILYIELNQRYGVPSQDDSGGDVVGKTNIQVPHPWSRSVNGIVFLDPEKVGKDHPFAGHGIGAEYDNRFLVRFTVDEVNGEVQGATYPFSATSWKQDSDTFLGPIAVGVSPKGDIYVGGMHDSGWHGGLNTGEIVRLRRNGDPMPVGIQEVKATKSGFDIRFTSEVDAKLAADAARYSISGYTRHWKGDYATPDSDRFSPKIERVSLAEDHRSVRLDVGDLKTEFVYDFTLDLTGPGGEKFFPAIATYTLNRQPE